MVRGIWHQGGKSINYNYLSNAEKVATSRKSFRQVEKHRNIQTNVEKRAIGLEDGAWTRGSLKEATNAQSG